MQNGVYKPGFNTETQPVAKTGAHFQTKICDNYEFVLLVKGTNFTAKVFLLGVFHRALDIKSTHRTSNGIEREKKNNFYLFG